LFTLAHSGALLFLVHVVKTRRLNEDFSMSLTLWLHLFFFFMLLVDLQKGMFELTKKLIQITLHKGLKKLAESTIIWNAIAMH